MGAVATMKEPGFFVPKDLRDKARAMRHEPTDAEKRLWSLLRERRLGGRRFRRQHPIPPYIVDFACVEALVVIEADGGQHNASEHDRRRDDFLKRRGWLVLRFWNNDILSNPGGVAEEILRTLGGRTVPHPIPPPQAGEGVTS
ncbi:ribonuclease P protein component [uncultured Gammaproteobacteria bacterium]